MIEHLIITVVLCMPPVLFLMLTVRNYRYAVGKFKNQRFLKNSLKVALIVPCRGLDTHFRGNIESLYHQDYEDYRLIFVVADRQDPAYPLLCEIRDHQSPGSQVRSVEILCAGESQHCGQKIHNQLIGVKHVGKTVDSLVFADADVQMGSHWLANMVYPLAADKHGASSGYRWFVPSKNNMTSIALSNLNARVAQMLGNTHFNHAWGGSMAIRTKLFYDVQLDKIWAHTISDDYSLSRTVKAAGKKVAYVPPCLNPSLEGMNWSELLEFLQRQFIITRVCAPGTWWFALWAIAYSCLGLWLPLILACLPCVPLQTHIWSGVVAFIFFCTQLGNAILRQKMALTLLASYARQMRVAAWADILLFPLTGLLFLLGILSSSWTRVVTWRGIRYRLISLTETIRLDDSSS